MVRKRLSYVADNRKIKEIPTSVGIFYIINRIYVNNGE